MSVIHKIAAQRQKLLDGIDANEGDINLSIFEDFYPDEAHFIYELLQNAEDAGATEVRFELLPDSCVFEHNGTRHFNEQDIRGITGIFNSTKKNSPDKIGKFGVGFKSVFVYTDSPIIYSREYSFKILKLVLPQEVPTRPELENKTRFEFPFNNPKKTVFEAYAEVKAGLEQLSETTLLFLNNLRYISWRIGDEKGEILREEHSESHVEVLKLVEGKEVLSSHWLRFSAPIENLEKFTAVAEGVERQKVAVAYELALIGDAASFDKQVPLAKQVKIVPAVRGKVSVFFPAEKETSGLRFHLHGPFVPELSRASIKNTPENLPLFGQLADVTARSLHAIKELGLLTGEFLAVLPNNDDELPERYATIRKAVLREMRAKPLVPTYAGGHAPAQKLYQARAGLKSLLSDSDLAFVTGRDDAPEWAIGATQRNSNQDRFLASLEIQNWDTDDLKRLLESRARNSSELWRPAKVDPNVVSWLEGKPIEWFQALYAVLYRHCEDTRDYGSLQDVYFVRLTSGKLSTGRIAYFHADSAEAVDALPKVDERVLTIGSKKAQQEDARKFLEKLGVRQPNEVDAMVLLLRDRYGEVGDAPSDEVYLNDLKRMIAFSEKYPSHQRVFQKAFIFKVDCPKFEWARVDDVYLDEPFIRTNLRFLYGAVGQDQQRWPLHTWYTECGIPVEKISAFAEFVGCPKEFKDLYGEATCTENPNWAYLRQAPGERWGNSINRDFALSSEARALLKARQTEASLLVWTALSQYESKGPSILRACFRRTEKGGAHYSDSQLVCALRDAEWVPQSDGRFVRPSAATLSKLPKGFVVDAGYKWLDAVGFGTEEKKRLAESTARVARRAELGFRSEEELQRAQEFAKLPVEEQEQILALVAERRRDPIELPERPVRNVELRKKRVGEEASTTPEKESEVRSRAVQLGAAAAKTEAKLYLMGQYTNTNGQMICQVCKDELPFRLPTGAYYFEAVEIIAESAKRYREGFLALCPNHAAAYQYANAQKNSMLELIATAHGNEIEVALGGRETTIYFTQTHLADIKACFEPSTETE